MWGTKTTPADAPNLGHPAERVQGGVPDLEMNFMTGWYWEAEVRAVTFGFSPVAPMTGKDALAVRDLMRGYFQNEAKLRLSRRAARGQRA